MIRFECDYCAGAHPKVLQALSAANLEGCPGYGEDSHCTHAAEMIRSLCKAPDADVHLLVGGTQTNLTVIAAALRPHQGVVSSELGHIALHETGAIEATGHKVLTLPTKDGKITAGQIEQLCHDHFTSDIQIFGVQPGIVYLSQTTELGTVYSLAELEAIRAVADKYGLYVFMDGARLIYSLPASDITLADAARLCDVFYIGGTKAGTLIGEAVVIVNDALKRDFRYFMKQRGGLLAKGFLLGIQFEALMGDGLYQEIGRKATEQALRIKQAFLDKGFPFLVDSPTNQQFPILPNDLIAVLDQKYTSSFEAAIDPEHSAVRFCTSWATTDEGADALIRDIQAL